MAKKRKMDDEELVQIVERYRSTALNREDGDVSTRRTEALKAYRDDPVGDEQPGRSAYKSREVFETVEWILPSIQRVFMSCDKPVEVRPRTRDDIDAAAQETDVVNYWIKERNPWFLITYNWFKDALLSPNSYVKVFMDEHLDIDEATYHGVTAEAVAKMSEQADQSKDFEILEYAPGETLTLPVQGPDGQLALQEVPTYDIRVRITSRERAVRIEHVPPEELLVAHDWSSLDLDECPAVIHERYVTRSDLVLRGFDTDILDEVGDKASMASGDSALYGTERSVRQDTSDEDPTFSQGTTNAFDPAMAKFKLSEAYLLVDYDGDGIAERRRVTVCGGKILENVIAPDMPFVALATILMPHRHLGMSLAEAVMDLQRLSTVLHRQLLDNIYAINVRRIFINRQAMATDGSTLRSLANPAARVIEMDGVPGQNVLPDPVTGVLGEIAPVLEAVNERRKIRTGVSPETSLDPEILRETTAHAYLGAQEAASQRVELIVRVFAETGVKKVFQKVHQLLRRHFDHALTVELRGKWVEVNPADWKRRTDMRVTVGLGYNGTQQTVAALTQVYAMQKENIPTGLAKQDRIYHTLEKLVEAMNVGHAPEFFVDPNTPEFAPPPPPPDPALLSAQALMADAQNKMQAKLVEVQANAAKAQAEARAVQDKIDVDLELKAVELQLKEAELALRTHELNSQRALDMEREMAQTALAQAQALLSREQALYQRALAEKTAEEAKHAADKAAAEVKLDEAKATSLNRPADAPGDKDRS